MNSHQGVPVRLPNFFIIGAIKGGTTSLYAYLKEHPQIYMSPLKEPRYLCFDPEDPVHRTKPFNSFPVRTLEGYGRLFDGVRHETAIGEASPQYLRSRVALRRMVDLCPNAKVIASLRDPLERAYSEYIMHVRAGNETRPVREYFLDDGRLDLSCYYNDVKRYRDRFGPRLKVVLLEDIKRDALGVARELFNFLEVETSFAPNLSQSHNVGGLPRSRALHNLLHIRNKRVRLGLRPFVPVGLRTWRMKVKNANLTPAPALPQEVREEFGGYFRDDILRLSELIGRDLHHWCRLES